ncbi:MAG: hypothetical protein K9M56_04380 [Victivallales bacterium]|nr:hypothetical protein [Victivallales bacterium]
MKLSRKRNAKMAVRSLNLRKRTVRTETVEIQKRSGLNYYLNLNKMIFQV